MVPCVILLALDKKEASESDSGYTVEQMRLYGILAVTFGILAPLFWTTKAYFLRLTIWNNWFRTWDMGIDHMIFQALMQTVIYVAYLCSHDFIMNEFI
mmetsp:Transcript_22104/g.27190  ORF Transcript_22104/g.27190 Transcript_22104/m.27190 type:complete len:98 (+) Transcript_22104:534-827(+)